MGAIIVPGQPNPLEQLLTGLGRGFAGGVEQARESVKETESRDRLFQSLGINPATFSNATDRQNAVVGQEGVLPGDYSPIGGGSVQNNRGLRDTNGRMPNASKLTDEQLLGLTLSGDKTLAQVANFEMKRREQNIQERRLSDQNFDKDRNFAFKQAQPFLKRMEEARVGARQKKQALSLMEDSIENGNFTFGSIDAAANWLARFSPTRELGESLRTAKGAQLLTSMKEFLLSNISRAGARPNMWIEQQIQSMLPQIGRTTEANLGVLEVLRSENEVGELEVKLFEQFEREDQEKYGYIRGDIASRVNAAMQDKVDAIRDRLSYRLREIYEQEQGPTKLMTVAKQPVPKGTPLTPEMHALIAKRLARDEKVSANLDEAALKRAKQLGYTIYSGDTILEFQRGR